MPLQYEVIVNGVFGENCYLVWDDTSGKGIFIDPGDEPERLLAAAARRRVAVEGICNTHGHIDHVGAVASIRSALHVPFALHPDEAPVLKSLPMQAAMFGLPVPAMPEVDIPLADGAAVTAGGVAGTVICTPGHTPGGVCFLFENLLFCGDTLFAGSIGRSDLPGGNGRQLITAIKERLLSLADGIIVLPGHGPSSTVGEERKTNPFLGPGNQFDF
jgi:glyoxylase-like metal-dependent hydrolase (beta-lactamase superfamily II)